MADKAHIRRKRAPHGALFPIFDLWGERLLIALLLGSLCLFVLYPMIEILLRSVQTQEGPSLAMYATVWEQYGRSLGNSLFVGANTAILCTAVSAAVALFIATRRGAVRWLCMAILLIAMVSPPFVSALAYIQLYGRRGWITYRLLGLSWNPYNAWGVIGMQSISFVPLNALFLMGILSRIDQGSLDAARDLGASPRAILIDVVLPAMGPGLLVSLLLTFVRSLSDFTTPVIIGGRFSTIASDIYLQLVGYSDLEKASAMNMFLLLPCVALFFLYRHLMGMSAFDAGSRARQSPLSLRLSQCGLTGMGAAGASGLFFALMVLQYGCIFLSGFFKRTKNGLFFTLEYARQLWRYDAGTMARSVVYALIVAVVGTLFAMLFSYYVGRRRILGRSFFDCLVTMPYMLPGTCFGIGYILAFNHPPLRLTGTALIVLTNMLFKQLPTSTKICAAALAQTPVAQEYAARDLGAGRMAVLKDVILPGLRPAALSCFSYHFTSSMTTAGAILFLIDPARKLAVFKLFDAVYTGDYAIASLIATLIILIVVLVEGTVFFIAGRVEKKRVS